jgi:hypothetical protein
MPAVFVSNGYANKRGKYKYKNKNEKKGSK